MKIMVPLKRIKENKQHPGDAALVKEAPELTKKLLKLMEKFLVKDYVAESEEPTLADFAAYCEFVQIELMGIFDLTEYPSFSAWMQRMKKVPHHDEIHQPLDEFLTSIGLKAGVNKLVKEYRQLPVGRAGSLKRNRLELTL